MRFASLAVFGAAACLAAFAVPDVASACGGCFAPPSETTVVTDHRMALSVSKTQTVLWDQIRYSGNPREFAWVLPVREGARVELSRDDWFAALDATTQPVIYGPRPSNRSSGCALGACGASDSAGTTPGDDPVQVLRQDVVGPYETVTLRSTNPGALRGWLGAHGYAIPKTVEPTIDQYVNERFDFIALRLLPDCNVRSMKPVRVVTPGADPTLPLRMVAAGVGAYVGLTLYVIAEGRYHPQNFPDAEIDYGRLTWNRNTNRSNYQELSAEAMSQDGSRAWVTEYSKKPGVDYWAYGSRANPTLYDAYYGLCGPTRTGGGGGGGTPKGDPCTRDAGTDANSDAATDAASNADADTDAGADTDADTDAASDADTDAASDADTDAASDADTDAASDADTDPEASSDWPPSSSNRPSGCSAFDDLDVAMAGMAHGDVWVTRLRANLRSSALDRDLKLEADVQRTVDNVHSTSIYDEGTTNTTSPRTNGCSSSPLRSPRSMGGASALLILAALGARRLARRRGR